MPISRCWMIDSVVVHDLDRVLDRHDVGAARAVDVADHRGDRRRLAGPRRSGDQDQPTRRIGERLHDLGHPQLLERRDLGSHTADRQTDDAALAEDVHPEPSDAGERDAEVGLARRLELPLLVVGHQLHAEGLCVSRRESGELRRLQLAVDTQERDVSDLQVQVARPSLHRVSEQLVDLHGSSPVGRGCTCGNHDRAYARTIGTLPPLPKPQFERALNWTEAGRAPAHRIPSMTSATSSSAEG